MHPLAGVVSGDFDLAGPGRGIESRQQAESQAHDSKAGIHFRQIVAEGTLNIKGGNDLRPEGGRSATSISGGRAVRRAQRAQLQRGDRLSLRLRGSVRAG